MPEKIYKLYYIDGKMTEEPSYKGAHVFYEGTLTEISQEIKEEYQGDKIERAALAYLQLPIPKPHTLESWQQSILLSQKTIHYNTGKYGHGRDALLWKSYIGNRNIPDIQEWANQITEENHWFQLSVCNDNGDWFNLLTGVCLNNE